MKAFLIFSWFCLFGHDVTQYEKELVENEMIQRVSDSLNQCKLRLSGFGGESHEGKKKLFFLSFDYHNRLNREEARMMMLYICNQLMVEINKNEKYRKYLVHYPFTINDIRVVLYIMKPDYSPFVDPELSEVFLDKGVIRIGLWVRMVGIRMRRRSPMPRLFQFSRGHEI